LWPFGAWGTKKPWLEARELEFMTLRFSNKFSGLYPRLVIKRLTIKTSPLILEPKKSRLFVR